jgi:molybdate transport system permease protein
MSSAELHAIGFTVWVCLLSTLCILPAGVLVGWLLARRRLRGRAALETVLSLPLVMPPVATGLVLLRLLGRRGFFGGLLHRALGVDIAFTWRAVVIAAGVMSFPLLLRSARVAFQQVDPRLEQIARTLGASDLRVFWSVSLPLAGRGLLSGTVLAFGRALGEFGATILVAGNIPGKTATLSLSIYQAVQLGQDGAALRLVAVSTAIAFAAIWASELLLRGKEGWR